MSNIEYITNEQYHGMIQKETRALAAKISKTTDVSHLSRRRFSTPLAEIERNMDAALDALVSGDEDLGIPLATLVELAILHRVVSKVQGTYGVQQGSATAVARSMGDRQVALAHTPDLDAEFHDPSKDEGDDDAVLALLNAQGEVKAEKPKRRRRKKIEIEQVDSVPDPEVLESNQEFLAAQADAVSLDDLEANLVSVSQEPAAEVPAPTIEPVTLDSADNGVLDLL